MAISDILTEKRKVILKENLLYPLGVTSLVGINHLATHEALAESVGGTSVETVLSSAAYEPAGMAAAGAAFIGTEAVVLLMQDKRGGIT